VTISEREYVRANFGEREPSLLVIVAYCDLAQINASVLIDDRWNVKDLGWAMPKKK